MIVALLLASATAGAQTTQLPADDRIRLAEVRRLATTIQDSVWPGWGAAPFAVLLVTDSVEFLVWHPRPSADFQSLGYDSLLGSDVLARPRSHPPNFLATFPAVGGVVTIVVGEPAKTRKNSTMWVLTLLHEHFHQLQMSRPGYLAAVDGLQLSHGDQTGMWMLTYPFPYDSAPIQRYFVGFAQIFLRTALTDSGPPTEDALRSYARMRRALGVELAPADLRYLDFQLWQEGVARYIEYATARVAARSYTPSASFAALPDFVSYGDAARALREQLLRELRTLNLGANKRATFYPVGAARALLLDRTTPGWKERYFASLFTLDP
ncbi:MAG TPA: hypothetical protein VGQ18_01125 [Gemmatimonadales bacterium]|nr:hypothetical protein [Gemmatimonadales bacterium]